MDHFDIIDGANEAYSSLNNILFTIACIIFGKLFQKIHDLENEVKDLHNYRINHEKKIENIQENVRDLIIDMQSTNYG
jgi:Skp family chaperone for outer membrane proteins